SPTCSARSATSSSTPSADGANRSPMSHHGHSHGLATRSHDGVRAVGWSLLVLLATAAAQVVVYVATGSVALLADLVHNAGDALTALPLGAAFLLRSARGERYAGYVVVVTIFFSACVAAFQAIDRLLHPQPLEHLLALAFAGVLGFAGNEVAAVVRLRAG